MGVAAIHSFPDNTWWDNLRYYYILKQINSIYNKGDYTSNPPVSSCSSKVIVP